MNEIQRLEVRNRDLVNEIARLNTGRQTVEEQNRIDGNFEEIEKNKIIISNLEK
jgi:cell division protein FtsB